MLFRTLSELGEQVEQYQHQQLQLEQTHKQLDSANLQLQQLTPLMEFLYGDMLAWGVCVEQDVELGLYYIENAAHQGLPAALEQIGRYYSREPNCF